MTQRAKGEWQKEKGNGTKSGSQIYHMLWWTGNLEKRTKRKKTITKKISRNTKNFLINFEIIVCSGCFQQREKAQLTKLHFLERGFSSKKTWEIILNFSLFYFFLFHRCWGRLIDRPFYLSIHWSLSLSLTHTLPLFFLSLTLFLSTSSSSCWKQI